MISGLLDELARALHAGASLVAVALGNLEAGETEVGVDVMEAHTAACGKGEHLVEVSAGAAMIADLQEQLSTSEETAWHVMQHTRPAQARDRVSEVLGRLLEALRATLTGCKKAGTSKREVVKRDIEEPPVLTGDSNRQLCPAFHLLPATVIK